MNTFESTSVATRQLAAAALFLGLTAGTAWGQTASNVICNGCVGGSDIANFAVSAAKLSTNSVSNPKIVTGAVTQGKIANGAVTGAKIANFSVSAGKLSTNAVTNPKIAPGAVTSGKLAAQIELGGPGNDGDLHVKDALGRPRVLLDGDSGNLTNFFSNQPSASNGLLKAWARINSNGSIHSCWRCNTNPSETLRIGSGEYHVDFTPLGTDISGRPFIAANRDNGILILSQQITFTAIEFSDMSTVFVTTQRSTDGVLFDYPFTVLIY